MAQTLDIPGWRLRPGALVKEFITIEPDHRIEEIGTRRAP